MLELHGTAASSGAAIGKVYCYTPFVSEISQKVLLPEERSASCLRLEAAKLSAEAELRHIIESFGDAVENEIFGAHLELLSDEEVWEEVIGEVHCGTNPELALDRVFSQYIALMQASSDEMMRERAADLKDVRNRLLRNLAGKPEKNLSHLTEPVIVVAHDLLPADTATMDRSKVLAIVTEVGGQTSHSAILARSYSIPAVLGVENVLSAAEGGMQIAVDGSAGQIVLEPDEKTRRLFEQKQQEHQRQLEINRRYLRNACQTADGVRIEIGANIGEVSQQSMALEPFTDLIGLFRTEFLYMQGETLPTEQAQFDVYTRLLRAYGEKPVILRTLDVGGDKDLPCLPLPHEENPFLGKRALRLCLDREDLFVTQLRAALRASVYGNLWIMFPMVGTPEDWRRAKSIADRVRGDLQREGIPVSPNVKFGIMIEVPAIVIMADQIVGEVDFASIGTNDLCQYTLAVDRGNPALSSYYQMYSPAVFRLVSHVAKIFQRAGKPICVCGEIGGDEAASLALVGMGIRKLSMSGSAIASIKRTLAAKTLSEIEEIANRVLHFATAEEVETYLKTKI